MSDLMLDVDQAGELKAAFRWGNWTNAEIKKACEGDFLYRALAVLRGQAEIAVVKHVIDCDADPMCPYEDWKVEEHRKGGQFIWNPEAVKLHLSPNQMGGKRIEGHKLRKELVNEPVLNANVLDYLIRHPHLVPEELKKDENGNTRYTYFWGTIYRLSDGLLYVRCLYFREGLWQAVCRYLGSGFGGNYPSLVRAS